MAQKIENPAYRKWKIFNVCGLLLIFLASTAAPLAPYNWEGFYSFSYKVLAVLLAGAYLFFNHKTDKPEIRLVMYFCLWLVISRMLNGDLLLAEEGVMVLDIWVSCLFLPFLMVLSGESRLKVLDFVSAAIGVIFTAGSALGIYTAVSQNNIINPLSQWYICEMYGGRLYMFGSNPNIGGFWLMITVLMLCYLVVRYKNPLIRIACLLCIGIDYTALALTDSRNALLGISVSLATLVIAIILRFTDIKKAGIKALVVILALGLVTPLVYCSFEPLTHAVGTAANRRSAENTALAETVAEPSNQKSINGGTVYPASCRAQVKELTEEDFNPAGVNGETEDGMYDSSRGFKDSGRLAAYRVAIPSLINDPPRIIRGCMQDEIVDYLNEVVESTLYDYGHYHNSLLQTLQYTGLPGFILTLGFWILLIIRAFRLFFSNDKRLSFAMRMLIVPLPAIFIHNMLETSAFNFMDFRSLFFFMLSGAVIAFSYEICPPKRKII